MQTNTFFYIFSHVKIRSTYRFSATLLLIAFFAGITVPALSNCMVFSFSDEGSAMDMHAMSSMSCCSDMTMSDASDNSEDEPMTSCGMSSFNCFCDAGDEFPVTEAVLSLIVETPEFRQTVLSELILDDSADEKPAFSHTELTNSYSSPPLFQVNEAWLN